MAGDTRENRGPPCGPRDPASHRCTPTPRPRVCAPRPARGSPSRPGHGSPEAAPGQPVRSPLRTPAPAGLPRSAAGFVPPPPPPPGCSGRRVSRSLLPSVAQLPRRGPGREGAWRGNLDAEPPAAGSGDTWSPTRLGLAVSKQNI